MSAVVAVQRVGSGAAPGITELELRMEQLSGLCLEVELIRSWFCAHEAGIRAYNNQAGRQAYDLITGAAMSARSLARAAGIQLDRDYIDGKNWHKSSALPEEPEVGPAPPWTYLGGDLGMSDDVTMRVRTPQGDINMSLQQALRHIDSFAEPGRTRILLGAAAHFGYEAAAS